MIPAPVTGLLDRVGGLCVDSSFERGGGEPVPVHDPSTGTELIRLAAAGPADVDRAVGAAAAAFRGAWGKAGAAARADALATLAAVLAAHADELALLEAVNAGKPLARARGELGFAVQTLRYFAGTPLRPAGEVNPSGPDTFCYTDRIPLGVCAGIVPSNYPLLLAVWKLAAALAYGNTMVLKPAEETPLSLLRLAELAGTAGLPPGTFSVVSGGPDVGAALCRHPDVAAVSFTGSVPAGRAVGALCGQEIKPVSLELGGKSPVVVCADADLDLVVPAVVAGSTGNTGQMCVATGRVLVDRGRYGELAERLTAATATLRVGGALDDATQLGPMVSAAGRDRVLDYVRLGVDEGACLQGAPYRPPEVAGAPDGYYVRPAVFTGADARMRIAREEIFGPVLVVSPFDSEEAALAAALDTPFGLAASVWTRDAGRARRFARDLRAGMVWVNTLGDTEAPVSVGGLGLSGFGRELGVHAAEQYTVTRSVWIGQG